MAKLETFECKRCRNRYPAHLVMRMRFGHGNRAFLCHECVKWEAERLIRSAKKV